ncbi:hypothetical protein EVAR_42046_1 [Eumeta japonica]|uniref:Uncharacterized protein n=1 Tax=Eumeta variegata TaxID=151549 RepID=A0A4C1Y5T2_EUMVA|nr:hypothetical protein EVAR_42046_1 [Eumeta japonica]
MRACGQPENRWTPPPMGTCISSAVTSSASPTPCGATTSHANEAAGDTTPPARIGAGLAVAGGELREFLTLLFEDPFAFTKPLPIQLQYATCCGSRTGGVQRAFAKIVRRHVVQGDIRFRSSRLRRR